MTISKTHSENTLALCNWYMDHGAIRQFADTCDADFNVFTHFDHSDLTKQTLRRSGAVIELAQREFRKNPKLGIFDLMKLPFFDRLLKQASKRSAALKGDTLIYETVQHATELGCVAAHLAGGLRTYDVSEGLLERLKLTSTDELTADDIQFPHSATWFQFPKGAVRSRAMDNKLTDIVGCMVREVIRHGTNSRVMEITLIVEPAFEVQYATYVAVNIELPFHLKWDVARQNMALYTLRQNLGNQEGYNAFESFLPAVWDLLINLLMYATHPDAANVLELYNPQYTKLQEQVRKHPKGTHKRDRAKEQLRLTPPMHRIVLGRGVTPLPPLPAATKGVPLSVRTLVQGHWQRFAIGKGRVDRTWKFRSPFWRGPEGAREGSTRHVMV